MPIYNNLKDFYSYYERPLAAVLWHINQRGFKVDLAKLTALRKVISDERLVECEAIAKQIGRPVAFDAKRDPHGKDTGVLLLSSPKQIINLIRILGLPVPVIRGTHRETTKRSELERLFAKTGHDVLRRAIRVRTFNKIESTNLNAPLYNETLFSEFVVTGTIGGRRSSRENYLGLGTNTQNLPKHEKFGSQYRECLVARPGKIFVVCDQKGAEDWLVQGIIADTTGVTSGLDELYSGINRHIKLASFLFNKPAVDIDDKGIEYYLGKRVRHAGNYGMYGNKMSEALAEKGLHLDSKICQAYIDRFHAFEPMIRKGFQHYVESELQKTQTLTTPIGRVRFFLAMRPFADNSATYRGAYSYIPQSTVGDNTGLAIISTEANAPGTVLADWHDALVTEVNDSLSAVVAQCDIIAKAFKRTLVFPNGTSIEIPVKHEIGYDLKNTISFDYAKQEDVEAAYEKLR